jgi:hypothetical protein
MLRQTRVGDPARRRFPLSAWVREHRRQKRDRAWRRFRIRLLIGLLLAAACAPAAQTLIESPWPPLLTLRHHVAGQRCTLARAVGLAPARVGQPGYWQHLDADGNGIACEPLPRDPRWQDSRGPGLIIMGFGLTRR